LCLYEKCCFVTAVYCNGIWCGALFQSGTGGTEYDNKFDIALTEEKSASFSLNMIQDIFRHVDHINLSYGIACMDRRINDVCGSREHSKFIYTETQDAFFLPSVESLLTICQNITE